MVLKLAMGPGQGQDLSQLKGKLMKKHLTRMGLESKEDRDKGRLQLELARLMLMELGNILLL